MSCLFDSLSHFIGLSSNDIRQMICDYLEEGNILIDGIDTKDILMMEDPNYVLNMRLNSMGGAIEIQAACNIWNARILVLNARDQCISNNIIEFCPITKLNPDHTLLIRIQWNGGHYDAIKPK